MTGAPTARSGFPRAGGEKGLPPRILTALDELGDPDLEAVAQGPRDHAKGGAGFALAIAREHQQQALFPVGPGDGGIDQLLLALHTIPVTLVRVGDIGGDHDEPSQLGAGYRAEGREQTRGCQARGGE